MKHWSHVVTLAKTLAAKESLNWSSWWNARITMALPEKTIDFSGGMGRKVGDVTSTGKRRKEGSALETEKNQEGLYMAFADKTQSLLQAMDAIDRGDSNFTNECTADKQREIALSKLRERNKKVVALREDGVQDELDLTCGMTPEAFIGKFGSVEGMKQLEAKSRKRAVDEAVKAGVTDKNTIHAAGTMIWLASAKSLSEYFFIILALDHQHCCAWIDKEGVWRIFLKGEEVMSFQMCVGDTIKSGRSYDDCERTLKGYGHTYFEMWATSDEPFVIDLDPKSDPAQCNEPLHKKIRITSTSTSESIGLARAVKLSFVEGSGGELTSFRVQHVNTIRYHRLVAIVKSHYRFDPLRNCRIMTEYLGLKEGQSFEDLDGYKYHQNLSERNIRMMVRRENYLKKRMWEERLLGKWTDVDHLIGRSQKWMNSDFFCMQVSHSWNRAMAYVRIMYGDWLYGFASIEYRSGND
jgi:hypothetical protein